MDPRKQRILDEMIMQINGEPSQVAEVDPDEAKIFGSALQGEPERPLTNYEKQILEERKKKQQDGPNVKGFFGSLKQALS